MIGSVGGVELLYPILEQVHLPLRKRAESKAITSGDQLKVAEVKPAGEGEIPFPSPPPEKESPLTIPDVAWWFDGTYTYSMKALFFSIYKDTVRWA